MRNYLGLQLSFVRLQNGYLSREIAHGVIQAVIFPAQFHQLLLDKAVGAGSSHHFSPVPLKLMPGGVRTGL